MVDTCTQILVDRLFNWKCGYKIPLRCDVRTVNEANNEYVKGTGMMMMMKGTERRP